MVFRLGVREGRLGWRGGSGGGGGVVHGGGQPTCADLVIGGLSWCALCGKRSVEVDEIICSKGRVKICPEDVLRLSRASVLGIVDLRPVHAILCC